MMTRAVRGTSLRDDGSIGSDLIRDVCPAISDHLRNHVHLTNCIHLRNHMHRRSPVMAEKSLMRDLIALQRSRSLRDPSASPPSWPSPSIVSTLTKKPLRNGCAHSTRRSLNIVQQKETRRTSTSSPQAASVATSKVAMAEASSDHKSAARTKDGERSNREESAGNNGDTNLLAGSNRRTKDLITGKVDARVKMTHSKSMHTGNACLTAFKQMEEVSSQTDSKSKKSSQLRGHLNRTAEEKTSEKLEQSGHSQCNGFVKMKKRRFRSSRRARGSIETRVVRASVASNSIGQGLIHRKCHAMGGQEEDADLAVTQAPNNGCGIPWNWSRIHHSGKTFLDIAGRSLSCGLSDSRPRKVEAPIPQGQGDNSNMPITSDHISSSTNSESEALPLLIEPPGSQESIQSPSTQNCSGELRIFANQMTRHERDSDLASETANHRELVDYCHGRHRSLTQKHMPRTFKDIVGQNLAVQALSNAVLRRKVGLSYVFYGPHGTGKTSCARVFAKALNCQSVVQPKPCDACNSCISHSLGNNRNVMEVGPVGNFDLENIVDVLDNMVLPRVSPQYRVFIIDGCDTLPSAFWSAIVKIMDRAPRKVVFVFISTELDHLPHMMLSRCQKFFFPKLKDSDIIYALQWIATSEGLEIDKDALKLIASRSDGSLRDAEMTLDQLSLLGQKISLPLVQELVGLVSDEKLVDLLDLAFSADTVNTVKSLREIVEAGVEPLVLMSQLATIITDILAGSYIFTQERVPRKFFRRQTLSRKDMEKLRQALKTLSEAEKQLRMSNDKSTWLTAAMLQLAPDQQYALPSSADASLNHSPLLLNNMSEGDIPHTLIGMSRTEKALLRENGHKNFSTVSASDAICGDSKMSNNYVSEKRHVGQNPQTLILTTEVTRGSDGYSRGKNQKDNQKIWQAVLDNIQADALKQFVYQEGKLISVNLGAAPTVQLIFGSPASKSKAEKFRGHILHAFESVLHSTVTLEIRCASRKNVLPDIRASGNDSSKKAVKQESVINQRSLGSGTEDCIKGLPKGNFAKEYWSTQAIGLCSDPLEIEKVKIGETAASPEELTDNAPEVKQEKLRVSWPGEAPSSQQQATLVRLSEQREVGQPSQRQSLVRSKISLSHVIQKADGCKQQCGWSRQKAVSIAEKLEQENLRLEPRSRSQLCWRASRLTREKLPRLRIRTQRPHSLLKLVTCGRCLSARSPR